MVGTEQLRLERVDESELGCREEEEGRFGRRE